MNNLNGKAIRILVVEDDQYMQAILKEFLSAKYEVEIQSNGMEALAFLQNGNIPDLIIADLNTPKLNGLALIEQMKVSDFFNTIPVIILSGEESSVKRIECLNSGADDFIVKPFNPAELDARIGVILRRMGKLMLSL
ncbi:response regulator transcription factor [Mucilaginibacter gotjawali]|uniref:Response regulator MprA n=2 Tax=Mucilaginibacter gotjawali TaxID=1550579 RepID=A0A120MYD5_9SPHI|nr:response regulator transcription factor [Mucilaginibacter gotjawali]MBB3058149.1 DNA-binding response OmpR family regulator [Mucilaginibacter gotjawali]BAU54896.1 Response regulator MprA [Mucilaginibacter gotjawali]